MDILKNINDIKLLKKNQNTKESIFVGRAGSQDAIIIIKPNVVTGMVDVTDATLVTSNNRYYKYTNSYNSRMDTIVIYPALEEDIYKYCGTTSYLMVETYDDYLTNVYPKIGKQVEWINNILDHKCEQENILYEDDDFVLMPDIKWDNRDVNEMYCLAIIKDKSLLSIRDLTSKDIPLLQKIRGVSLKTIEERYGVPQNRVKAYFHYPPSFYHLHIHFNLLEYTQFGSSCVVAHSIVNVINNLMVVPNYYQTVDLEKWYHVTD